MPDLENSAPLEEIEIKEEELSDEALDSVAGGNTRGPIGIKDD